MASPAVLISGASTGIGRASALRLAGLGWRVFAGVRRDSDGAALRADAQGEVIPVRLDVTSAEHIAQAAATVAAAVGDGGLAGLINNAGIAVAGPLEFIPIAQLREQFEVNVVGQVALTQAVLPLLRSARGRVVFIGSMGGRFSQPFVGPYCASKFALEAINDALRMELRPWGVQVAIVEPGAVATPIWERSNARAARMVELLPEQALSLYGRAISVMRDVAAAEAARGTDPDNVAVAVEHALTARRPRTRYVVGGQARVLLALTRVLPDRVKDRLIMQATGLPR